MEADRRIEPLDKNNYDTWRIQAKAFLILSDGWDYVFSTAVKPEPSFGSTYQTELA